MLLVLLIAGVAFWDATVADTPLRIATFNAEILTAPGSEQANCKSTAGTSPVTPSSNGLPR